MTAERPDVTMTGRYTIAQAAKALCVSREQLYKKAKLPVSRGGIKTHHRMTNRTLYVMGCEILRFWSGGLIAYKE